MVQAAINGLPPPSPEQYIFSLCQIFKCLPSEILEEDAALIKTILFFDSATKAVKEYKGAVGSEIHDLPASTLDMIDLLTEWGTYQGGSN